ncbi:glycosyltransferase [Marmoricola sp. RAF53]|uniref:glycosyltransferase n=1 Tax=Marmoricola sp. RAF53 TaxID=3233059 RepID=UPI003F999C21
MNDRRLQIVIPAYNESSRLPRTLELLRRHVVSRPPSPSVRLETIVVDNASTDDTAALARAASSPDLRVTVLRCEQRGKGAAVAAGVAASDAEYVGFMDADGATALDAVERALACLAAGADVAVGSRAHADSVISARHLVVRGFGAAVYRGAAARVVPGVADTQCGFKVMRGGLGRRAFRDVQSTGFSFDVELLARLRDQGADIVEFPVVWNDVPGSTFHPAWHGAAAFAELAGIYWRTRPDPRPLRDLFQVNLPDPLHPQHSFAQLHV